MKSPHCFLVEPKGDRYNNTVDVEEKKLIVNTEIYNHQYVNREAVVLSAPIINNTPIKKGDTVLVHHNVFRRWHDVKGVERNSKAFFKDNKYIISEDQIFLYKSNNEWKPLPGYCFVQPLKAIDKFNTEVERPLIGVVKYSSGNIKVGELVGFDPVSTYEFVVDGIRMYRAYSKFITIKYEYQGNEETYNPSWAQSS
tara:strand:- start:118 stop:708 length:591 start_codon:yes stop_codon:yes gene_type:complete